MLTLLLTGCQAPPSPFQEAPAVKRVIAPLPDTSSVTVLGIKGLPDRQSAFIAEAMAQALQKLDIPAATDGFNRKTRFLRASVSDLDTKDTTIRLQLAWELLDKAENKLAAVTSADSMTLIAWRDGNSRAMRTLVTPAALELAKTINQRRPGTALTPESERIPLFITQITGTNGKDDPVLRRAMKTALIKRGMAIGEDRLNARLTLSGTISLGPSVRGNRKIDLSWTVRDRSGQSLGRIDQQNSVSAKSIESRWHKMAATIANHASGGIAELIGRLPAEALDRSRQKPL